MGATTLNPFLENGVIIINSSCCCYKNWAWWARYSAGRTPHRGVSSGLRVRNPTSDDWLVSSGPDHSKISDTSAGLNTAGWWELISSHVTLGTVKFWITQYSCTTAWMKTEKIWLMFHHKWQVTLRNYTDKEHVRMWSRASSCLGHKAHSEQTGLVLIPGTGFRPISKFCFSAARNPHLRSLLCKQCHEMFLEKPSTRDLPKL